jgi:hypothetical protein
LGVLLASNVVAKVPSLTDAGHLTVRYNLQGNAKELVATIEKLCQEISLE